MFNKILIDMIITFKKNDIIIDDSNWESLWQPKEKKQWKEGRSSKELAKYASCDSFKLLISHIMKECCIIEQNFVCEPEAKNSLGKGFNRGCRNHDLLMIGDKDCVIGVEAKVDEPFDEEWKEAFERQKKKYNKEVDTRAYKLRNYLANGHNVNNIGYQLFTATRGTICSAKKANKNKCIFLVIVFDGEIAPSPQHYDKVKKSNDDFQKFCKIVGAVDKPLQIDGIDCWVKKVTVTISNMYSFK